MNKPRIKTLALAAAVSIASFSGAASADNLDSVLKVSQAKTTAGKASQKKIDRYADETRDKLGQYKQQIKLVEDLKVYNRKLEIQIENQETRLGKLEDSIANVTVIQRQITPLLVRMIDSLEQFVALDVPFHKKERADRITFLRANLDRPDLTVAEKFRQVLEAYKIENEYGRKIDTYPDRIKIGGVEREVNMLRVGRVALLYQTTDTEHSGAWDNEGRRFVELDPAEYRSAIVKGIRIAKKQATKDILDLPIAAPEAFK